MSARPNGLREKLKLRFRVGDVDLPERRKGYTSSREEENVATNMCPCGTTIESRTHRVRECENVQGGMRRVRGEDEEIRRM